MEASPLLIEIWSDVVCPWCYIGTRNLEAALVGFVGEEDVTIRHRTFRLDPKVHLTRSSFEALSEKYGVTQVRAMLDRVSKLDAHRLLLWAQSLVDAQPLLAVMYRAYFEETKSLFHHENLLSLALAARYPADEVKSLLASEAFVAQVLAKASS